MKLNFKELGKKLRGSCKKELELTHKENRTGYTMDILDETILNNLTIVDFWIKQFRAYMSQITFPVEYSTRPSISRGSRVWSLHQIDELQKELEILKQKLKEPKGSYFVKYKT